MRIQAGREASGKNLWNTSMVSQIESHQSRCLKVLAIKIFIALSERA